MAYQNLYCHSPICQGGLRRHRVEIIQDPIRGNFVRYTCLACSEITDQDAVDDVRKTKLHKDSTESDDEYE